MSRIETSRLSNGITVVTETIDHLQSVALGVWNKSGARNEQANEHGIAHLLEHMAFKGTAKRSAEDIALAIENVGGDINAATSMETTSYYARVLKDDVPLAVDILADILSHPQFDDEELRREQHVILQEIGASHDTPDDIIFDHFTEAAFPKQALGRSILGTPESVQSLTSDDLRGFINREYSGDRMVMVAAGAVQHDAFVRDIETHFADMQKSCTGSDPVQAHYTGGEIREPRDLMDAQILLGFEGRAHHARDFYASQVLAVVLGGGMSSRLFREIRERRGLCYSIYAFHWGFSDTGLFGVHAATGKEDIEELSNVLLRELQRAGEQITDEEVNRARAQFRAGLLMSEESPVARSSQIARQMLLHDRTISTDETMDRISAISAERIRDLAERLFSGDAMTLAGIGPIDNLKSLLQFEKQLADRPK